MVEKILAKLEALTFQAQLAYMKSRRTREVIEPGRILFHPQDAKKRVMEEYKRKLKELKVD